MKKLMYKGMLLKDKIKLYSKEDLKVFAQDLGLTKLSKLRKDELAEAITGRLLDPEVMFYRMSIFDNNAINLFEKGIGGYYTYKEDEYENVCILNELDYAAAGGDVFYVFDDVAEVWKKVRDERFEAYRKRASWVWKCLYWTEEMYGFTPIENFLDVINTKRGFHMTDTELIEMFDHFPEDRLWTIRINDIFLSTVYAGEDALYDLRMHQADKDFYIPTIFEVEDLFEKGALISAPPYQRMKKFLVRELHVDEGEAEDILCDLWFKIAQEDAHDAMQWFWNQFEFEDDSQVKEIVSLYMPLTNGTRMIYNRGHSPEEMSRAATIPVMSMPDGAEGPVRMAQKKVYPNDPCPCGSGKKYKKCCGTVRPN